MKSLDRKRLHKTHCWDYSKQVDTITRYLAGHEKQAADRKIGVEFEHFILDKQTLAAVSYYGAAGVEETMTKLLTKRWQGEQEYDHLLALEKEGTRITLEPGAQFELSIKPLRTIAEIESEYLQFLADVIPILEDQKQILVCAGYHPQSKIADIPFIPKARYKFMSDYFRTKGRFAINMMKGTASMQVAVDYTSEPDFSKKFRVANGLSSVIAAMFDNSPFFEGALWDKNGLRIFIWQNCDNDRCGLVKGALTDNFGYADYAKYVLDVPPVFFTDGKSVRSTGTTPFRDLFDHDNHAIQSIEHMLAMVFPDVRAKQFLEIRMADSVPYPLNLAGAALWKGLLYNKKSLEKAEALLAGLAEADVERSKESVIKTGLDAVLGQQSVSEIGRTLVACARQGLEEREQHYLTPIEEILEQGKNPTVVTKERLSSGKAQAIEWCVLNDVLNRIA